MRKLSLEEQGLWDRLKQTVHPLPRRRSSAKPAEASAPKPTNAAVGPQRKTAARGPAAPAMEAAKRSSGRALAPFEEKTLRRLSRGLISIDDRIDLHGMRQERAYAALGAFLRRAQARGERIVLVVTGKGTVGDEGRGVLRSSVPLWLARPDLRDLVVGFEEAGRRHGGAGALYVRIRRRREARSPAKRG